MVGVNGQAFAQDMEISGAELISGQATDRLSALAQEVKPLPGALRIVAPKRWHGIISKQLSEHLGPGRLRFEDREGQNIAFYLPGADASGSDGAKPQAPDTPVAAAPSASDASRALKDSARSQVQNLQPQIMGADELLGRTRTLTPDLGRPPGQSEDPQPASDPLDEPADLPAAVSSRESINPPAIAPVPSVTPAAEEIEVQSLVETPAVANGEPAVEVSSEEVTADPLPDTEAPIQVSNEASVQESARASSQASNQVDARGAAKLSLQKRLNRGRPIENALELSELRREDVLFSTDGVIAVVRRSGAGQGVFWLNGEVDLGRREFRRQRTGRYVVLAALPQESIPAATRVQDRQVSEPEPEVAVAPVPAEPDLAEKQRMEKLFNSGRSIDRSLSVAALRPDDVLYVGNGRILVARRVQAKMKRYWLSETIDLGLSEIEKTGNRRYRIRRQIR